MRIPARIMTTLAAVAILAPTHTLLAGEKPEEKGDTGISSSVAPENGVLFGSAGKAVSFAGAQGSATFDRHGTALPRFELFLGYSYVRAVPTFSAGNRLVSLNGGSTSLAYNINRYFGLVADFGGYASSDLNVTGPGANPPRVTSDNGTVYTYLGGPRFSYRKYERFTPFAQALFGGVHASPVLFSGCTGNNCTALPTENAFALTAGGGLDVKVRPHLALRVVQAEYLLTSFTSTSPGATSTQNDIRLSGGVVLLLGGGAPLPLVSYTCAATPASAYAGDPITVIGTVSHLNPKRAPDYSWSANGGKINGNTATATIDTTGLAPGSYVAQGHVAEGSRSRNLADCSAPFTVLAIQPPSVSCSASPSSLLPGESATITAQGKSPQNRQLTYSYSASNGSITGSAGSATLNTSGVAPGPITVTCNVVEDRGQTASTTTQLQVTAPAVAAAPATQRLCSINFTRDEKRPTRVDNEAKACLDDIALNLQRSSDARLVLLGSGTSKEAAQRAVNTRAYLVDDKGIDTSRISVYTGSTEGKGVETILVPVGANLDLTNLTPVDGSLRPVPQSQTPAHSRR